MRLVKREPQEMPSVATGLREGFQEIRASVYVNPETGQIVITGDPRDGDGESAHNCDASGCGWEHVVVRWTATDYEFENLQEFVNANHD